MGGYIVDVAVPGLRVAAMQALAAGMRPGVDLDWIKVRAGLLSSPRTRMHARSTHSRACMCPRSARARMQPHRRPLHQTNHATAGLRDPCERHPVPAPRARSASPFDPRRRAQPALTLPALCMAPQAALEFDVADREDAYEIAQRAGLWVEVDGGREVLTRQRDSR